MQKIIKYDSVTITYGVSINPGLPSDVEKDTLVCRYNDLDEVKNIFKKQGYKVEVVIVEAVLIFDEVIAGFRLSYNN